MKRKQQLTREQVIQIMRERQGERTNKEYAEELDVDQSFLSRVYRGKDDPSEFLLAKLSLRRIKITVYEFVEAA